MSTAKRTDRDRDNALDKIAFVQRYHTGIEFIGISLLDSIIPLRSKPESWDSFDSCDSSTQQTRSSSLCNPLGCQQQSCLL
ncbi:12266_t:CDS:2 [Ambispora leptoticha]|uniref:12266_t:CDS:1 n=1 Tax=Ambispora leptoticha TaxID=144679 RepID=A0A9N8VAM0_9GLOM|nr:12266_t:CDS:2 [Ambispora leptoticha]